MLRIHITISDQNAERVKPLKSTYGLSWNEVIELATTNKTEIAKLKPITVRDNGNAKLRK